MKNPFQMIKQAVTTIKTVFSGAYPRCQANYNGKTTDFLLIIPYGLVSSPPVGSHVVLLSSQGQESVKLGIVSNFDNKAGINDEVLAGLRNGDSGSSIILRANGDIEIDTKNDLIATVDGKVDLTVTGDVNLSVTGDANITVPTGDINLIATAGSVNLGGAGGLGVARIGDAVSGGVITGGSTKVFST